MNPAYVSKHTCGASNNILLNNKHGQNLFFYVHLFYIDIFFVFSCSTITSFPLCLHNTIAPFLMVWTLGVTLISSVIQLCSSSFSSVVLLSYATISVSIFQCWINPSLTSFLEIHTDVQILAKKIAIVNMWQEDNDWLVPFVNSSWDWTGLIKGGALVYHKWCHENEVTWCSHNWYFQCSF